jgi:hypothetical protein
MIRTSKILLFILYVTILPLVPAWSQETITVTAEGVADIPKNSMEMARNIALEDAQKRAVEQVIGIMVVPQTRIKYYQSISDKILTKNKGYIKQYHVIGEIIDSGLLRVKIDADISLSRLSNDMTNIGIALVQMPTYRSIALITEKNIGRERYAWWCASSETINNMGVAENALIDIFTQKGFEFVDHVTASRKFIITAAYCIHDLTATQARTLGNEVNAEIVIVGKALSNVDVDSGGKMKSVTANLHLTAIRTDTGQVINIMIINASASHKSEEIAGIEAIKKAAQIAAREMSGKILSVYSQESESIKRINIIIRGLDKMQFVKFKDVLNNHVIHIKDLHERSFNETTARLIVESEVNTQKLSEILVHNDFGTFSVDVTGSTANSLELQVTPK